MSFVGAPPTWARRPGFTSTFSLHSACVAMYGEGYDPQAVRLWRRKLTAHHTSVRPPYYGSWSKTRSVSWSGGQAVKQAVSCAGRQAVKPLNQYPVRKLECLKGVVVLEVFTKAVPCHRHQSDWAVPCMGCDKAGVQPGTESPPCLGVLVLRTCHSCTDMSASYISTHSSQSHPVALPYVQLWCLWEAPLRS
jgi:hypothetical protein